MKKFLCVLMLLVPAISMAQDKSVNVNLVIPNHLQQGSIAIAGNASGFLTLNDSAWISDQFSRELTLAGSYFVVNQVEVGASYHYSSHGNDDVYRDEGIFRLFSSYHLPVANNLDVKVNGGFGVGSRAWNATSLQGVNVLGFGAGIEWLALERLAIEAGISFDNFSYYDDFNNDSKRQLSKMFYQLKYYF